MSAADEGPRLRVDPRPLALACLALPLLLQAFVPWSLSSSGAAGGWARLIGGGALLTIGLVLNVWGVVALRRRGEDPAPKSPSSAVVAGGPFRLSRNPMYLGFGLFQIGLGLLLDNAWLIAAALLGWLAIARWVVPAEEAYLEEALGETYGEYKGRVRRWL